MIQLDKHRSTLARKVRDLRRARGWTQRDLASRLELSQSRLSELENGAGSFSAEHLVALLQLFNVSVAELTALERDPEDELQNALVRFGADHLLATDRVAVNHLADLSTVIRDTLVLAEPRQVTALAPVVVRNIDGIDFNRLRARFLEVGFDGRLYWFVDNLLLALRSEQAHPLTRDWLARYRRATVVLETFFLSVLARLPVGGEHRAPDILDTAVRSSKTVDELRESASGPSARWNIITALHPADFASALAQARPDA
jgi:transcriptional regulator with XRE-family HTH domain